MPSPGAPAWVSAQAQTPLLDNLLPTPLYRFNLDVAQAERLSQLIAQSKPYTADSLQGGLPIERWELRAGEPRNLNALFSAIGGARVEDLVVRDPYCGASDDHRTALKTLLQLLISRVAKLTVHCRELGRQDERYQAPPQVRRALLETLAGLPGLDREDQRVVHVHSRRGSYDFHDRTLDLVIVAADGTSAVWRYDLTGGVDYLMDAHRSITVFHYKR